MAWAALAPLMVALCRQPAGPNVPVRSAPLRGFLLGLTTGVVGFTGTLYWITDVMVTFGGLPPPGALLANFALVAYLALYPALFGLIVCRLAAAPGPRVLPLAPAVWVTTEFGRAELFGGFPWVLLGYSQVSVTPVAQFASLFGVYGLSFLVAAAGTALAHAIASSGIRRFVPLGVVAATVAVIAGWGELRMRRGELMHEGQPITVGLVQGNIAQDDKWDPGEAESNLDVHLRLTRQAAERGARFVIWPESSVPFLYEQDPLRSAPVRALARETGVTLLVGSNEIQRGSPSRYYNSAFLVTPEGRTAATYRKIHLVPFGEYVPMRRLLFFVAPLVETVGDFSPGEEIVLLPVAQGLASTAICYEIVYPGLIRRFVTEGSQLLTTITNDAWYGKSSAPYQHFAQASMRAIEEGRYLLRAANTGITGIVDPYGRVRVASSLFERTALVGEARFLTGTTLYARIGDLLPYACGMLTGAAILAAWVDAVRQRRRRAMAPARRKAGVRASG